MYGVMMKAFFFEILDVTEKVLIILSHWIVLTSFYEADWWHFSDPSTTGISLKATVIIVLAVFLPTLLFRTKQYLFRKPIHFIVIVFFKLLLSIFLFLTSLPAFARFPWIRTGVLAVGLGVSPLLLTIILPASGLLLPRYMLDHCNVNCMESCSSSTCKQSNWLCSDNFHLKTVPNRKWSSRDCYSEIMLLVAVLLSMVIRWAFATVNVFYETWQASLVLLICLASFSFLSSYLYKNSNFNVYSNDRKSINSASAHTEIVATSEIDDKLSSSKSANFNKQEPHQDLLSTHRHHSLVKLTGLSDDADNLSSESTLPSTFDKSFSDDNGLLKPLGLPILLVGGIIHSFALGTLIAIFLWLFSTPNMLVRWSGESPESHGMLVIVFFAVGIILSLSIKGILDTSYHRSSKTHFKNEQISCWLVDILVLTLSIGLIICAGVLQMRGSKSAYSFIGSSLLCIVFPCCLTMTFIGIKRLMGLGRHTPSFQVSLFLTVIAFFTAVAFLIAHIILVSFINPQIFPLFLGRMDIILAYQILIIIASLTITTIANRLLHCYPRNCEVERLGQETFADDAIKRALAFQLRPVVLFFVCMILLSAGCVVRPVFTSHCIHFHAASYRETENFSKSRNLSSNVFSVLSWNVLLGHDMNGRDNMPCVGKTLQLIKPDVIGLEESDALPPFWGSKDIPAYLSSYLGEDIKPYLGVQPLMSSLGVALLTNRTVTKHQSYLLPGDDTNKLPHYSLVHIECLFGNSSVTIFNVHAVFKNWTATVDHPSPFAKTSQKQIKFIVDKINALNQKQPIIVMGDFNLNPNETQLDILHDLGFQNALHSKRHLSPPSTLRNRFAVVDHIFYRGLILSESKKVVETEDMSDHIPVMAYFHLPT